MCCKTTGRRLKGYCTRNQTSELLADPKTIHGRLINMHFVQMPREPTNQPSNQRLVSDAGSSVSPASSSVGREHNARRAAETDQELCGKNQIGRIEPDGFTIWITQVIRSFCEWRRRWWAKPVPLPLSRLTFHPQSHVANK